MLKKVAIILLSILLLLYGCESKPGKTSESTEKTSVSQSTADTGTNSTGTEPAATDDPNTGLAINIYLDSHMLYAMKDGEELLSAPVSCSEDLQAGKFAVAGRERWKQAGDGAYTQYSMDVSGRFSISSALYYAMDINALVRDSYYLIGENNSGSKLVYSQVDAAKWLYENCSDKTAVNVYSESPEDAVSVLPVEIDMGKAFTDPTEAPAENDGQFPYYIYIEKGSASITIYAKDNKGNYTYPIKTYLTATGRTPARTPVGIFKIESKQRWHEFIYPYRGGFAQYACAFYNDIMIHSPIYSSDNINAMTPEFYYEIGGMKTAGCLRTVTEAAYWIYTYCDIGTSVESVNGDDRGLKADPVPDIDPDFPTTDPTDPLKKRKITQPTVGITDCAQSGYVNMRTGPSEDYPVVARLGDDTVITVVSEENGWYKARFLGKDVYITKDGIAFNGTHAEPFAENLIAYLPEEAGKEKVSGIDVDVIDNLIDLRGVNDTIIIDLAFSNDDNFTGGDLYPNDICILQKDTAKKLSEAQKIFMEQGYSIKVIDAYRPISVQKVLFDIIKDPKYIADSNRTSHHNRGAAVDITLVDKNGNEVAFTVPAYTFTADASAKSQYNDPDVKDIFTYFVSVMESVGFYNYESEWWHFSDLDYQKYMATDHDLSQVMVYNQVPAE